MDTGSKFEFKLTLKGYWSFFFFKSTTEVFISVGLD